MFLICILIRNQWDYFQQRTFMLFWLQVSTLLVKFLVKNIYCRHGLNYSLRKYCKKAICVLFQWNIVLQHKFYSFGYFLCTAKLHLKYLLFIRRQCPVILIAYAKGTHLTLAESFPTLHFNWDSLFYSYSTALTAPVFASQGPPNQD